MSLCSGTAGVKSSSCAKRAPGAGTAAEAAGMGADASVDMNAADSKVAAAASGIAAKADDPVPVRSSWFMPTPFCVWAFVRDAAS